MSKNLMPEIAKMLGVEIGEEFKVKGDDEFTYKFTDNELILMLYGNDLKVSVGAARIALGSLLNGEREIVKILWKPDLNERYWTFMSTLEGGKLYILNYMWDNSVIDVALHKVGWVFRTCEEAQAALPSVAKELGVEYKL